MRPTKVASTCGVHGSSSTLNFSRVRPSPALLNSILLRNILLFTIQSGDVYLHYRNTGTNSKVINGMFLVIEPGETWICQPREVTFHHLSIDPTWLQQKSTELFQREKSLLHFPNKIHTDPALSRVLCALAALSHAPVSRLHEEEIVLRLFTRLLMPHIQDPSGPWQPDREHSAIKRAKDYLQAHYAEEVSLQVLATVAGLSAFHLARVFRQVIGLPPHAYQTQLRLAYAKTLLAQGLEAGYIAHETGFADQSHFTQQFKRHFLVTPGSYRKTARFL